ncbi:hypothetical protein [Streptomyces sp. NPDC093591]
MAARKNEGGRTAMIKCGPRRTIEGGRRRATVHARVGTVTDEGGREAWT